MVGADQRYEDVGLDVDCSEVKEEASGLYLALKVAVSTAVSTEAGKLPVLRQYSWDSNVLVPIGKAATVYSDSGSQYKMEVKVTATPIELR